MKVLEVTREAVPNVTKLVEVIRGDPALVVRVLRVVNSSMFALRHKVGEIQQAVNLLGAATVATLALGFSLVPETFAKKPSVRAQQQRYWKLALIQAVASHALAKASPTAAPGEYFVTGLLKDIGQLALLHTSLRPYMKVLARTEKGRATLLEVEQRMLGFDHLEITCKLFERWRFPPVWVAAVAKSRFMLSLPALSSPLASTDLPSPDSQQVVDLSKALATADGIAWCLCSPDQPEHQQRMAHLAYREYRLGPVALSRFLDNSNLRVREQALLYSMPVGELLDYETILARANAQLVVRALETARVASARTDEKRASGSKPPTPPKGDAPDADSTASSGSEPLRGPSSTPPPRQDSSHPSASSTPPPVGPARSAAAGQLFTDPLTGLYTRPFFFELIQHEYLRCIRHSGSVGMLCLTIDQYVEIQGRDPETADRVLVKVAQQLREAVRESGTLARSDQAEFSLLLLGPDVARLEEIAELMRVSVELAKITSAGGELSITASVGAALALPESDKEEFQPLAIAAASALDMARREGGNRVCVA